MYIKLIPEIPLSIQTKIYLKLFDLLFIICIIYFFKVILLNYFFKTEISH